MMMHNSERLPYRFQAVEAKNGHAVLARTIQELLSQKKTSFSNLKIIPRNKDVDDLLLQTETYDSLNDLVTDKSVKEKLGKGNKGIYKKRRTSEIWPCKSP